MFGLSAQRKCPIELRERAMRLVVEARADTLTRRGAFTRIGGGLGARPQALRTRMRCGAGRAPFRRPWTQRVAGRRHPLRARANQLGLRLLRHQRALAATPPAPPGGRVPGPRGYRQRLWPCRANIQPDDRRAGREEGEPGSKLLPSRREPADRAPRHHAPSTGPSTIQCPTLILTDNHNGYTQTITRVLR